MLMLHGLKTIIERREASLGPKILTKDRNFNEESKKAIINNLLEKME
jgi:hypothetical protein